MAVLGRKAILQAIQEGWISITPFVPERVGPASLDLTLARTFRVFRKVHQVIEVREHTDYRQLTEKIEVPDGEHILIMPGETVLGITRERLRLGPGLCGWLEGRSRFRAPRPDGSYQRPLHGARDRQPAGAGDEQLRPCSPGRIPRHRDLPVRVPEAGGQRELRRQLRRPDGRLLLTSPRPAVAPDRCTALAQRSHPY